MRERELSEVVSEEDRAECGICLRTWYTGSQIGGRGEERLLHMEEELHKREVGQDWGSYSGSISYSSLWSRYYWRKKAHGLFSLSSVPTGVEVKTELAKSLADFLFGDEKCPLAYWYVPENFVKNILFLAWLVLPPGYV